MYCTAWFQVVFYLLLVISLFALLERRSETVPSITGSNTTSYKDKQQWIWIWAFKRQTCSISESLQLLYWLLSRNWTCKDAASMSNTEKRHHLRKTVSWFTSFLSFSKVKTFFIKLWHFIFFSARHSFKKYGATTTHKIGQKVYSPHLI